MSNNIIKRTWKQGGLVNIEDLRGSAFQAEEGGHTFLISGVDENGNAIAFTGSVGAVFLRADNTDVTLTGSIANGVASVTLTDECYDVPGRFGLTIYVTDSPQKVAVYAAVGSVSRTSTGVVSPGAVEDVADLIAEIAAAVATIPQDYSAVSTAVEQESLEIARISGAALPIVTELGSINTNTGKESASSDGTRLRTNYIPIEESTKYTLKIIPASGITTTIVYLCYYSDKSETAFIRATSIYAREEGSNFTTDAGAKYVRLRIQGTGLTVAGIKAELTKYYTSGLGSRWYGKKIAFFGGSRTWYDGHEYNNKTKEEWAGKTCIGYQHYVETMLGATATNQGVSGETSKQICDRIREFDFSTYDAVFLEGGVNDFIKSATIGSLQPVGSTFDTNTVYGAWQSAIEYIQTEYPNVQIFMSIPAIAWDGNDVFPYSIASTKGQIADLYNIPCIDLYKSAGITEINRDYWYADDVEETGWRLHFNDYGNKLIGEIVAKFIDTNWNDQASRAYQPRVFDVPTTDFYFKENDDLNDLVTPGRYVCTTSTIASSLEHSPFPNSIITLIVMNLSSISGKMIQICIGSQSTRMAIRIKDGTFDDWNYFATENDLNNYARFDTNNYVRFSANDNLNSFTTPGSYICPTSAVAESLVNSPFPGKVIRLFVSDVSASSNTTFQTVICRNNGKIATRAKTSSSAWSDWNVCLNGDYKTTLLYGGSGAWDVDGYLNYKGEPVSSDGRLCSGFIAVNGGDYLRFVKCTSNPNKMICCFYNSDEVFIGDCYAEGGGSTTFDSYDVLVPSNAAYVRAGIRATNSSVACIYTVSPSEGERTDTPEIILLKKFTADVKGKVGAPFVNLRASHAPLFTLIDDDTRNFNQVNDFYTICNDTGIKGTSSVITKYLAEREGVKTRLVSGEREGHQAVLHCYDQDACPNTHWQHPEDYPGYTEIITDNVVHGIQDMIENGFIHWNTWVTPGGTRNPLMYEIARTFGLKCTVSITQNDYLNYDDHWTRWGMPRMELYPNDEGHAEGNTLAGIKANIDKCVSDNGWLIVGIHVFQSADNNSTLFYGSNGWNNEDYDTNGNAHGTDSDLTRFRARFARIYEMINYAKTAGMKCVTLGEGLSYWEPILRFYETF